MWKYVNEIALENNLDGKKFLEFSIEHQETFDVIVVNTLSGINARLKEKNIPCLLKAFEDFMNVEIVEIEQNCINLIVKQKVNGNFDVIVDDVVRHPDCDCFAVMRALAHYLNSYAYSYDKFMKKTTE